MREEGKANKPRADMKPSVRSRLRECSTIFLEEASRPNRPIGPGWDRKNAEIYPNDEGGNFV
jgi:hypothetical protein